MDSTWAGFILTAISIVIVVLIGFDDSALTVDDDLDEIVVVLRIANY